MVDLQVAQPPLQGRHVLRRGARQLPHGPHHGLRRGEAPRRVRRLRLGRRRTSHGHHRGGRRRRGGHGHLVARRRRDSPRRRLRHRLRRRHLLALHEGRLPQGAGGRDEGAGPHRGRRLVLRGRHVGAAGRTRGSHVGAAHLVLGRAGHDRSHGQAGPGHGRHRHPAGSQGVRCAGGLRRHGECERARRRLNPLRARRGHG
mmetsp:Transcript_109926/g.236593  ORF Transcript_109926/g.236593 Transcript_109926/m.236593 type:complete len:201 (-) Transcript_109926:70-672(-)